MLSTEKAQDRPIPPSRRTLSGREHRDVTAAGDLGGPAGSVAPLKEKPENGSPLDVQRSRGSPFPAISMTSLSHRRTLACTQCEGVPLPERFEGR